MIILVLYKFLTIHPFLIKKERQITNHSFKIKNTEELSLVKLIHGLF